MSKLGNVSNFFKQLNVCQEGSSKKVIDKDDYNNSNLSAVNKQILQELGVLNGKTYTKSELKQKLKSDYKESGETKTIDKMIQDATDKVNSLSGQKQSMGLNEAPAESGDEDSAQVSGEEEQSAATAASSGNTTTTTTKTTLSDFKSGAKYLANKDKKIIDIFNEADNGDGKLNDEEMESVMKAWGVTGYSVAEIKQAMDSDGDGQVSMSEIKAYASKLGYDLDENKTLGDFI